MKRKKKMPVKRKPRLEEAKAQALAEQQETQVWLLASPAETDQLSHGLVPLDIQRQARHALQAIHGVIEEGSENGGTA